MVRDDRSRKNGIVSKRKHDGARGLAGAALGEPEREREADQQLDERDRQRDAQRPQRDFEAAGFEQRRPGGQRRLVDDGKILRLEEAEDEQDDERHDDED